MLNQFFGTPTIRLIPSDKVQELLAARQENRRSLKHDPIEMSEEYLSVIDEVEEKIDKTRVIRGRGSCYPLQSLESSGIRPQN